MKKSVLITLICSMMSAILLLIGGILVKLAIDGFEIEARRLVISSASAAAVYDGNVLADDSWHLTEGELKEGHMLSVSVTGKQTGVGISENHISAQVLDESGFDVSEEYSIEYRPGILNVKERDICLIADSDMKLYDGTPLTKDGYSIESAISLISTDTLSVTVEGSITEIGEEKNRITSAIITNDVGEDVTRNYNVKTVDGKLVVYSSDALVFESDDNVKYYDGTPLTNDNWALVSGSVMKDHVVSVNVTGSQTEVGGSENTFTVTIFDENGNDVTDTYEIVCRPGTLNVLPVTVTIKSDGNTKIYDGTPLTDSGFITDPVYLTELGFEFIPVITGSQTEIGKSENFIESCVVIDSAKNDVTKNFTILYDCGMLEVLDPKDEVKEKLVIVTSDGEKTYDGLPLENKAWEITEGALMDGHSITVTVKGTQTDVGMSDNLFDVAIADFSGNDVKDMYDIEEIPGVLEVFPLEITVVSADAQKVYDGEPLTCSDYKVYPEYLKDTFIFDCQIIGSRTEVGQSENTIGYCRVYNLDNEELSIDNFTVVRKAGTLTVVEKEEDKLIELTYSSGSAFKTYDATPLECHDWERISGELKPGHREEVIMNSSLTAAGKADNTFTVIIYDENDIDVTEQYAITYNPGTLTVNKKGITVTANTDSKQYDGTALENKGYSVKNTDPSDTSAPIPYGDTIAVTILGSITEPGRVDNTIQSITITNADGEDVTDSCYDIEWKNGELKVTNGSENVKPTGRVIFKVRADIANGKDKIYLKERSFGNYNPSNDSWESAPEYGQLLSNGGSAYYLPATALKNSGAQTDTLIIDPVGGIFAIPYYTANGNFAIQTSDSVMVGSTDVEYTVKYYNWDNTTGIKVPSSSAVFENEYASFVKTNYIYVDADTYEYMLKIIEEQGFSASDSDIINKVAKYIQSSATYNLNYNTAIDKAENPVIAFLTEGEGVCRHYAKAATLLFRSLGIPARYTQGFVGDVVSGDTVSITDETAHAWVEVYVADIGWVRVEVTGSSGSVEKIKLKDITPYATRKIYDGTKLIAIQKVTGADSLAEYGYTYEAVISGTRTELGITTSIIENFIIRDGDGKVIYNKKEGIGTNRFDITYKTGIVHVYLSHLTFTSIGKTKVYDGHALECELSDIKQTGGTLYTEDGYTCVITPNASITDVGSNINRYTVSIYKDGVLVNDHYWITSTAGYLNITARSIVIEAGSAEKEYVPGKKLTCNEIIYDDKALADTDHIESYIVEGSKETIGNASNIVRSVVIKNTAGKDVTSNYSITVKDGKLTVKPPKK